MSKSSWRLLGALLVGLICLGGARAILAAPLPDPAVTLELSSPAEKAAFYPGDVISFSARIGDPEQLVRRVFVRLTAPRGAVLNAAQEATVRAGAWTLQIALPLSVAPGVYTLSVDVQGDGNVPLHWAKRDVEVRAAKFGLRIVSPAAGAAFHRNEPFDVVIQVDDPRRKARRVFVYFQEPRARTVLNGDREALRRGNLWTQRVRVPATAVPGRYAVLVDVLGEGLEKLGSQREEVLINMAPVTLSAVTLEPPAKIYPGDVVKCSVRVDDPRRVVREVMVSCTGPDGKEILRNAATRAGGGTFGKDLRVDDDQAPGTYHVQFAAIAQGGEVVASAQAAFTVLRR